MDPVAELVGQREHVPAASGVVEQHVREHRRRGGGAERSPALPRPHGGVHVALGEEPARQPSQLRREGRVAVEHDLPRLGVAVAHLVLGHGRHAVVVGQPLHAEQPGLQPVPGASDLVAATDRFDEGVDGLVAGFVGEVAGRQPVGVAAQAVVDRLVGEQRVEHVRPRPQPGGQRLGDRPGGRAALLADGAHQPAQRHVEGHGVSLGGVREAHPDRGRELLEQARPGTRAGEVLLRQHLLLGLAQEVVAVAAGAAQVMAAEVQALAGQQLLGALVAELRPLQLEEQQRGLDRRLLLLGVGQQRSPLRVGGVGGEGERGEVAPAGRQLLDLRQLAHRLRERRRCRALPAAPSSSRRRLGSAPAPPSAGGGRPPPLRRRPAARGPRLRPRAARRGCRFRLLRPSFDRAA